MAADEGKIPGMTIYETDEEMGGESSEGSITPQMERSSRGRLRTQSLARSHSLTPTRSSKIFPQFKSSRSRSRATTTPSREKEVAELRRSIEELKGKMAADVSQTKELVVASHGAIKSDVSTVEGKIAEVMAGTSATTSEVQGNIAMAVQQSQQAMKLAEESRSQV